MAEEEWLLPDGHTMSQSNVSLRDPPSPGPGPGPGSTSAAAAARRNQWLLAEGEGGNQQDEAAGPEADAANQAPQQGVLASQQNPIVSFEAE